ncbi:MAG: hypothetical protein ACKVOH_01625 [Chlamydiales bacterium]
MKEIISQFFTIWRGIKPSQKLLMIAVILSCGGALGYFLFKSSLSGKGALFSTHLTGEELKQVRLYLEKAQIPYKEKGGRGIFVAQSQVTSIREELAALGIPRTEQGKGFELFDTNTWIKGEKELQVLEMRALKGQLEKDLTEFDNIKSASVILDLAPVRKFGNQQYQTKASVILTLMPKVMLSSSQLRAIAYHLAGAVRGLNPNMIAISDTTGRLYQSIDSEVEGASAQEVILEEQIRAEIDQFLEMLVGKEHFYSQVEVKRGKEGIAELNISLYIDKHLQAEMGEDLPGAVKQFVRRFHKEATFSLYFLPFEKKTHLKTTSESQFGYISLLVFLLMVVGALFFIWPLVHKKFQKKKDSEEDLLKMVESIDMERLARSMEGEEPEVVAWTLSYLEPGRAQQMIQAFSPTFQKAVLYHLSELETEEL